MSFPTRKEAESSISLQCLQPCQSFTFDEIQLATENFDQSLVIGHGGFGKVYKGTISNGSSLVVAAIKRLDSLSSQGAEEFWAEVEMLSNLRHCHLVSLIGYCNQGREMILVYEYMPHGTLEDHLHKLVTPLSWIQRLRICIGAARGLDYLHTGTGIQHGIIHRDVKSSNILLHESWAAKISDFGLSKVGPTNQPSTYVNTLVKGTFGYLDPDYFSTGRLTRKSDVYAFGVVLLEVLCGKQAVDRSLDEEEWGLVGWAQDHIEEGKLKQIIDLNLMGQISAKCLNEFAKAAYRCLHSRPKQRPTMAEIVVVLESVLALQEKTNNSLQPARGIKIFGRKLPLFKFSSNGESSAEQDPKVHLGHLKRFSLHELQVATDNFSQGNFLRWGAFYKVYRGRLAGDSLVAVKRLVRERTQGGELHFQREVEIRVAGHRNLLVPQGICMTPTERLLVCPYMANGSVASCLRGRPDNQEPLDWLTRKRIALGSARGLAHLHDHCDPKIIHRDVAVANILLDEVFEAAVGEFGLAKLIDCKDTHVNTAVRGTTGFVDPEYAYTGKCSEKTDVFGYGVVLLELITGQRAFDLARLANDDDAMLLDWLKGLLREKKLETLVDPDLKDNYARDEMEQLMQVAMLCQQRTQLKRPKMSEVVRMLEGDGLSERWEEWQNEELLRQESNNTHNPNTYWIFADSADNLGTDELSGPR